MASTSYLTFDELLAGIAEGRVYLAEDARYLLWSRMSGGCYADTFKSDSKKITDAVEFAKANMAA
jgi:hypothetical protein